MTARYERGDDRGANRLGYVITSNATGYEFT